MRRGGGQEDSECLGSGLGPRPSTLFCLLKVQFSCKIYIAISTQSNKTKKRLLQQYAMQRTVRSASPIEIIFYSCDIYYTYNEEGDRDGEEDGDGEGDRRS
jgi:hypothetical protein